MSKPELKIRLALPKEYERIGVITVAAYQAVPGLIDDDKDFYLAELEDVATRARSSDVYVAVDDSGQILGAVAYVGDPKSEMAEWDIPHVAGFRMLAVAPEAQGRGVGRLLTQHCIDLARAEARAAIVLHTLEALKTARLLYARMGFERDASFDVDLGHTLLEGFRLDLS